jgi:hypothetical protein
MLFWLSVKGLHLNERFAEMTQHNKSILTYTHMLVAAGNEFCLFDEHERDYCRASANSEC